LLERKEKKTYSTTKSTCGTLWLDILIRNRSGGKKFKKEERQKVLGTEVYQYHKPLYLMLKLFGNYQVQ
jgi:hypothetical protein